MPSAYLTSGNGSLSTSCNQPSIPIEFSPAALRALDSEESQDLHDWQDSQEFHDSHDPQEGADFVQAAKQPATANTPSSDSLLALPLGNYVRTALEFSEQENKGQDASAWRSPMFSFARFCKAHPAIAGMPDDQAAQAVEDVMSSWDDLPESRSPWERSFPDAGGADSALLDFMVSWNSVRHVPFGEPLQEALRLADENPLKPLHLRGALYQRFISLAGWLQVLAKEQPIFLPTRTIGQLLGCDQRTVSRLRQLAVQDQLVKQVKRHRYRSAGKSEATEFRFRTDCFEALRDER